jgi:hypothetical protein
MSRFRLSLIVFALLIVWARADAQEPRAGIGSWVGCFATTQDPGREACGTLRLDSVQVCGHLAEARYDISFVRLVLPSEMKILNQGTLHWQHINRSYVAIFSETVPAVSVNTGETVCTVPDTFFDALGEIVADSLNGTWGWNDGKGKKEVGRFRFIRSE